MDTLRSFLESRQVWIYFAAILLAIVLSSAIPATTALEPSINPALAFMLFVTFLQVPLVELASAFRNGRFLGALLATNFIAVPLLVAGLIWFAPDDPMLRLAILLVLLTPCIDYVVTFTHLGQGDARSLLASTPILLLVQMLLLPVYLGLFLGDDAANLVQPEPFIHALVWLIAVPLLLAVMVQYANARFPSARRLADILGVLPVPATALVLFLVIASVTPRIGEASSAALSAAPIYLAYAAAAPVLGWLVAKAFRAETGAARAVAFSAATRNSLVVLPLAFAVPGGIPLLPAVIVTQTMIELISELIYIRVIPRFLSKRGLKGA